MLALLRRLQKPYSLMMVVLVAGFILVAETLRRQGIIVPIPFLLLYAGVVASGSLGGLTSGVISGALASGYVIYAAAVGFGPSNLTGGAVETLMGCLLYAGTGYMVGRVATQRSRFRRMLEEQEESRRGAILENITQGVVIYDADLAVASFNEHFIKILGLPPGLVHVGTRLEDILRYRAERGDYGQGDVDEIVRQRLERARFHGDAEKVVERILPDGLVCASHRRPLPGGGWVTTYTDITALHRAERAREKSEEMFRKTFENSGVAIMMRSLPERTLTTNAACLEMLGYSKEELEHMHFCEITHPDDWNRYAESRKRFLSEGGIRRQVIKRIYRKDGKIVWVALDALAIRDEHGDVTTTVNLLQDITDSKLAEQELARKSALLETSVEAMAQAYVVFDAEGRLVAHNKHFETMFGFPKGFFDTDRTLQEVVRYRLEHENYGANTNKLQNIEDEVRRRSERYRSGRVSRGERTTADGRTYFFNRMPMPDGGAVSTYTDITEVRQAEAALRLSEAKFRGAFENAGVGVFIRSADGKSREFNRAFCDMLGYSQDEMASLRSRYLAHPEDTYGGLSVGDIPFDKDGSALVERRFIRKDGKVVWCAISYKQVRDADGQ